MEYLRTFKRRTFPCPKYISIIFGAGLMVFVVLYFNSNMFKSSNTYKDYLKDVQELVDWKVSNCAFYSKDYNETLEVQNAMQATTKKNTRKKFLYLVQCSSCLPDYHLSDESLGGGATHDVLVLSYCKSCERKSHSHITYLNAPTRLTWTSGRNYLYRYTIDNSNHFGDYLYYIFMDCDVKLVKYKSLRKYKKNLDEETKAMLQRPGSVWRLYEEFLDDHRPALGDIDHEYKLDLYCGSLNKNTTIKPYFSGFLFDAMVNAFHRDVVHDLLPYDVSHENESWWYSQLVLMCQMLFRYHAQVVILIPYMAENLEHSTYIKALWAPRNVCKAEQNIAPQYIRKYVVAQKIMHVDKITEGPYYTHFAPKKTKIEKYKHFNENIYP